MALEVRYSKEAFKALRRMPANDAVRVRRKIHQYAADPDSLASNVEKLTGFAYLRLRVGDYRVIMLPDGTVLEVIKIGVRGGIYDR